MSGFMDLLGGIGSMFGGAAKGVGNAVQGGFGALGQGLKSLFGESQQTGMPSANMTQNIKSVGFPSSGPMQMSPWSGAGQNIGQNIGQQGGGNMLSKLFTGGGKVGDFARGLGMMGISQMIPNAKQPSMPTAYNDYMGMMAKGGTPGMQAANTYYTNILNGGNQDAYDAAYHSLDLNYQEQLRQLNSMYKSLRPGSDPANDSTYQRDLQNLNDQYTRQRAQVGAQVQGQAAQGASTLGTQQMQGLQSGIDAQLNMIAQQWGMNSSQRQALRNSVLGLGQGTISQGLGINNLSALKGLFD